MIPVKINAGQNQETALTTSELGRTRVQNTRPWAVFDLHCNLDAAVLSEAELRY